MDAGSHRCQRLRRLHPARQLRHLPILPIDGGAEELPPSQYEQFVARALESSSTASTAAQRAAASAASTASNAAQVQTAAQRTSADSAAASRCAARAEAAAAQAEELVPKITQKNRKDGTYDGYVMGAGNHVR